MILDKILCSRKEQLAREKSMKSPKTMIAEALEEKRPVLDFASALASRFPSIIAEVKKASPSKGLICKNFDPVAIAKAYEVAGANAISVLTEETYFGGSSEYLKAIRSMVQLPILRKDFIFDSYQLYESRVLGADAVLLIAAMLSEEEMADLLCTAHTLGLHALVETHHITELEKAIRIGARIIGINNRNLNTFHVDLHTTEELAGFVPKDCVIISESGISTAEDILFLKNCGVHGVLIGEALMRSGDIASTMRSLRSKA